MTTVLRANRYLRGEISEEKVEALVRSYETIGFWDGSIQGRPHPEERGCVEIAFGHHRLEAARRKGLKQIGIVVSDRSNDDMMRMMADENRREEAGLIPKASADSARALISGTASLIRGE